MFDDIMYYFEEINFRNEQHYMIDLFRILVRPYFSCSNILLCSLNEVGYMTDTLLQIVFYILG